MSQQALIVKPGEGHPALHVIGVKISVLVSDAVSSAQRITLQSGPEGAGPPPHSHDWDESLYVIRGRVHFSCNDQATACTPGALVHIPANTVHAFSFGSGGGEMLEITGAGSQTIAMFSALDREIPSGPPDIGKVVQVAGRYGVSFQG